MMDDKKNQNHGRPAEQRDRQKSPDAPVPDQDAQRAAEREPQYRGDQRGGAPARDLEIEKDDAARRPPG